MERTRDLGSALAAAVGGVVTALAFVGLYVAVAVPVAQVLQRLV